MLDAILLDDEKPALDLLRQMLEETGRYLVSGAFRITRDAEDYLATHCPDVVFLDVEMREISGIQFADVVRKLCPRAEIVFITAHADHALEAYRLDALGYLLKPIHEREIERITERLLKICRKTEEGRGDSPDIRLFERVEVLGVLDGRPIRWRTAKTEELFSFLYLQQGSFVHKDKILEALWPEYGPDRSQSLLYTTMYQLKKSMLSAGAQMELSCANSCYKMTISNMSSDVCQFDRTYQQSEALGAMDPADIGRILKLYRGDLLVQHGYMWSESLQRTYQEKFVDLATRLADRYEANGKPELFETIMKGALERLPWHETLHRRILAYYLEKGKRSAFLAHYKQMEKDMYDELGIVPDAEMRNMRLRMK